jgi:hypothetical protein
MLVAIPFAGLPPASAGLFLTLLSDPDDGRDMFLRNFGLFPNYNALKPQTTVLFMTTATITPDPEHYMLVKQLCCISYDPTELVFIVR